MVSITSDGTYHMGVLTGTVTGEYQAGYLGIKARERNRLVRIEECKKTDCRDRRKHRIDPT